MKLAVISVLIAVLSLTLPNAVAAPDDVSAEFVVAVGLEVTLWAESPLFFKPTNIDVDERGRIWVAEGVNYRTFRGQDTNQPEKIPFRHPEGDRIVILEDVDGDGAADSSKVFVQDKDLVAPLGVAVIGNRVFVSCSPHLIAYTMDDRGDRPVKKEIFLTGFGGYDHDHGVHSVVAGPDGRLYFNVGNAGPHQVSDRNGKTIRAGSIYTGGSPYNTNNTPNLRSDDGRVWTGGLALRVEPDGRHLTPLAHNFRNSYEVAVDSYGDLWQNDNDDEVRACRTSWMMEGGNMGFFAADGTRTWRADQRPGQSVQAAHWHQDDPGVLPAGDIYGAGGPTGAAVYEGDLLPEQFRGVVLNCDAGRNTVFAHRPVADGAGFRFERAVFLTSQRGSTEGYRWDQVSMEDKSTWFRPSDVVVGTDGAVYVADWHDPVVGGHAMRSTNGYGRILRIAPVGGKPRAARIDLSTTRGQVAALRSPAINVRFAARERVITNLSTARPLLEELARSPDPILRARAAWFPGFGPRLLNDPEAQVRVAALRAARQHLAEKPDDLLMTLGYCARDVSPAVRREVAVALRDVPWPEARPLLLALLEQYAGRDRFHLEALGLACEGREELLYPLLIKRLGGADPLRWSEPLADLIWRLHPVACVPAVAQRAGAVSLPEAARLQAVDTLAFIEDRSAAEAMLSIVGGGILPAVEGGILPPGRGAGNSRQLVNPRATPSGEMPDSTAGKMPAGTAASDPVQSAALWWARFRAGNDWKAFDVAVRLPDSQGTAAERAGQVEVQALRRTLLATNSTSGEKEKAAISLAGTETGGLVLLQLAGAGQLPAQFNESVIEAIFRNPSLAVRALASQYFPRPSRSDQAFPPMAELMKRRGNATHGGKVFASETAGCVKCHAFGGVGQNIGPDLATARTKLGREGILDAILNPSAVIAAGYEPWLIDTTAGETYSGFIVADGDTVTLKDPTGGTRAIPAKQIASRQQQKLSLMPDNIALGLTPEDLVDLVEYLMREGAR